MSIGATHNDPCHHANPALKVFHHRLAATNKKPKVIIVAVMRKMITTLNAMLRDNVVWQPKSA
jgi:transposase